MLGRHCIALAQVILLAVCVVVQACAFAEALRGVNVPTVEHASFHQVAFSDPDLVILNNRYPPAGDSGFHSHDRDQFYVVITDSESRGQSMGEALGPSRKVAAGTAGYGGEVGVRRVHRVINGNEHDAQFIVVEFLEAAPKGNSVSSRETAPQYVQLVDNERLRAWRLILKPGESTSEITQVGKGVRIVVRGGLLSTLTSGAPEQTLLLRPADFAVQAPGTARKLRNIGKDTIELVEFELK